MTSNKTLAEAAVEYETDGDVCETAGRENPDRGSRSASGEGGNRGRRLWLGRSGAFVVDAGLPATIVVGLYGLAYVWDFAPWALVLAGVGTAATVSAAVANSVFAQGRTGSTVGKSVCGIRTVTAGSPDAPGWFPMLVHQLAHVIDTLPVLIGWFLPLFTTRGATLSDLISRTDVVRDPAAPRRTRSAFVVLSIAAIVSVSVAGGAVLNQYRPSVQAVEDRNDLGGIVTNDLAVVLSYAPDTIDADVEAARALLTGDYANYYSNYANSTLIAGAKNDGVATETVVQTASVVDVDGESAVALAYLAQTITSTDGATPTQRMSTVRVGLTKVDGTWKISSIDPI